MALPMETLLGAVRSSLEAKGVLAKMRADLRLAVFTAIDEKERSLGQHLHSSAPNLFKHNADLRLLASLVADLCDRCGLRSTRACLAAETGLVSGHTSNRFTLSELLLHSFRCEDPCSKSLVSRICLYGCSLRVSLCGQKSVQPLCRQRCDHLSLEMNHGMVMVRLQRAAVPLRC